MVYRGVYKIRVGASSRDVGQPGRFEVRGGLLGGTITQAEVAILDGGAAVSANHGGYTGSGYITGFQEHGAGATFTVKAPKEGRYNLTLRYASTLHPGEQSSPRSLNLYVNDVKIDQIHFSNLANMGWSIR